MGEMRAMNQTEKCRDFPVDAGIIGIIPLAAMEPREGFWPDGGLVVTVRSGRNLGLIYNDGVIVISADDSGTGMIYVPKDTQYWIGDLCYVLENNIPIGDPQWHKTASPEPGYWAAAISSFQTPRDGRYTVETFPLPNEMQGLVARTQWGDGYYPSQIRMDGHYLDTLIVFTNDFDPGEEEEE